MFARVESQALCPGVDVVYYGSGGSLEFDLAVAPETDPVSVRLRFEGSDALAVDPAGDLRIAIAGREVVLRAPIVYQERAGGRDRVDGRYTIAGRNEVGFELCGLDPTRAVVIDPVLAYSTFLGGGGEDSATGIATDAAGNVYVTGYTASPSFPTTMGAYDTSLSVLDAFVSKLDPTGTTLLYSTYLGGSGSDQGNAIAVDVAGNAYVAGQTGSTDFPVTANAVQAAAGGGGDGFVTKLDATGGLLLYSTYVGGNALEKLQGIALDSSGHAYAVGSTWGSTNFPTTSSAWSQTPSGSISVCFAKFDTLAATGPSSLLYSTYFGAGRGFGVAVDATGKAYLTGYAEAASFPTTPGAYDRIFNAVDAFVAKLDPGLSGAASLVYSTLLGGGDLDGAYGVAVDGSGQASVAGHTESKDFPTTSSAYSRVKSSKGTQSDAFVTKLNASGSGLIYSTYLGGGKGSPASSDVAQAIAVDPVTGHLLVAGYTVATDFPTTADAYDRTANGDSDGFVAELVPNASGGASLAYASYLGGNLYDSGLAVAVDPDGSILVAGVTKGGSFPVTAGSYDPTPNGLGDAFVLKLAR